MSPNIIYLNAFWENILEKLKDELSKPSFETWLSSTKLVDFSNNRLTISVSNEFAKDWLESRYSSLVKSTVQNYLNAPVTLNFIAEQDPSDLPPIETPGVNFGVLSHSLNPKYTFDTFVIGNGNRFAHAAALAVAESPAKSYNPLFVYGGSGLGKTHLMHAISHVISKNFPSMKILYVTGEQFTNEMIDSIRYERQVEFRNTYRKIDILLIDDIQFLAGKEGTQEEFFHTFNTLYEANKQIIISSDRPPREIPTLEERLRSRFEWGLTTDINPPDYETRIAILRKKAELENFIVPDEIIIFIASEIQSNIRELEGALSKITAYCMLTNQPITVTLAEEILKDMIPQKNQKLISLDMIQKSVAEHYKMSIQEFKQKKRTRTIAFPRQIAMFLCREMTDLSLEQIGDKFGGRDHTTVIHACEKISELKKNDPLVEKSINDIISKIKSS
ncbi:MAG: chromosomal replication initiator protein DnaA [Dehalobacter sp. 4CP]|uniref:chromosomal replication initiator protein DnaA n=1 Tax=Dehalobacter sp. CP TaxID=2594474 RepID=UPI0013C69CF5|nr:chromosomal replication initiator protein DnaA [Dehalobacter sp. 4CP]